MNKYKNLTVVLPTELYSWLIAYKKRRYISLSALVTDLLKGWREKNEL